MTEGSRNQLPLELELELYHVGVNKKLARVRGVTPPGLLGFCQKVPFFSHFIK